MKYIGSILMVDNTNDESILKCLEIFDYLKHQNQGPKEFLILKYLFQYDELNKDI